MSEDAIKEETIVVTVHLGEDLDARGTEYHRKKHLTEIPGTEKNNS